MKCKVFIFFITTTLFLSIYLVRPVSAETVNELINICNTVIKVISTDSGGNNYVSYYTSEGNNYMTYNSSLNRFSGGTGWYHYDDNGYTDDESRPCTVYNDSYFGAYAPPNEGFTTDLPITSYAFIILKGSIPDGYNNHSNNFDSLEDYENSLNPYSKWYDTVWETFKDYMTNPVLGQWIDNLIDRIWSDEGGTIAENVNVESPTIAPTATPIPYSTVVVPRTDIITGETVYETNYYYTNPSGTPTVAPYPPTNSPADNGGGNGNSYAPVNGEPYSIPRLSWLTSVDIGDDNYNGIDSIYDGIGSIDSIGSEYTNGMSAAQDATGTLPDSWLLLIGVAAAIPLIAGVISRFLS